MADERHHLTRAQVIALLDEVDTLREHNQQLRDAMVAQVVLPTAWGLTAKQALLLRAIRTAGPNVLHHERALLALYDLWEEVPERKILDVMVCNVRRKLARAQVSFEIETIWGRGWRMTPEACAAFDAAVAADRARWDQARAA